MGKLSSLLSMWEKKAESNNNNTASNIPPKRTIFKKPTSSDDNQPQNIQTIPDESSKPSNIIINENIRNETITSNDQSNSIEPSAPPQEETHTTLEESQDETTSTIVPPQEETPSAPLESQDESSIVVEELPSSSIVESSTENSLEETSQVVDETIPEETSETIPQQQEEEETISTQEIPQQEQEETTPQIPDETTETNQEEIPQDATKQGEFLVSLSELKAIVSSSPMSSSLQPIQRQLDLILQQNNCQTRDELPSTVAFTFDSLKTTLDLYMDNIFTINSIISSVLQVMALGKVTDDLRLVVKVLLRHCHLIEKQDSNIITLFSLFIQMAFGTQEKIDLLLDILRNDNMNQLVIKYGASETSKAVLGAVYPTLAKVDFKMFFQRYSKVYFAAKLPATVCASYCAQVYKEAAKYPEYVEPFIEEAVVTLGDLIKLRNEPIERLFCNGLYNMVKDNPEKFFNSEKYDFYETSINESKKLLFDSNKTYIEELFDLKKNLQSGDDDSQAGEDFILLIEFNGKKKKTKESGNITFALLVKSILEKFQIQEEHQSMNELFDRGVIVEYFEDSINDWVELERIEDIPRSPKVAKIRIIKEEIQVNQISQIIERNTNIQLVNDKYQILKRIGKGGFGSVYSANAYSSTETKPSLCALKYIEIDSIVNFNRSMREGIQMLQLDHANIARISDVFEVQSSDIGIMGVETKRYLCFAMPLYSHGDLYELVKNQSQIITEKLLGSIMKQLMDSLTYLHEEYSIVHRDIKPQNVLIESIDLANKTLKPILSDFGLAKTLLKTETQVAGTASYMSPEMSSRRGYNLSTDIWSMGVMFYQLLSFDFNTDVKGKVQNGEFDFLTTQIERTWSGQDLEIITSLKKLTFDMLNLDPDSRPTAKQAFEALASY
ncbi:hypothetical protein NAEGRDRAFT_81029 [Naegleria gruberi]|uniref:non-specific serine/threonine protein kinase n=1 Tax=Naegleria gruberi TaxID=5762 RepID=D2VS34_NAEGR|nr:uncharacterized protein NAEGRDRAFT_81029 [Naegleria gruberi]EFC40351.1 hypothetical protein NAEGRDRAFT_81029 [Naegleria gruberi]|eukprot:XP_002673095.1 hypothetical protein NAEGRDRAFT_81029 [Naegleria gruberi strain NEG-M]